MKTLKQVKKENAEYAALIDAVIEQLGGWDKESPDQIENINRHGIGGGFCGFIYHSDTVKFFNDNRANILALCKDMAAQFGEGGFLELIMGFNCLSSGQYPNRKPDYTQTEIAAAIYENGDENETQIKNALSWFAAEEVCRMFEND